MNSPTNINKICIEQINANIINTVFRKSIERAKDFNCSKYTFYTSMEKRMGFQNVKHLFFGHLGNGIQISILYLCQNNC